MFHIAHNQSVARLQPFRYLNIIAVAVSGMDSAPSETVVTIENEHFILARTVIERAVGHTNHTALISEAHPQFGS